MGNIKILDTTLRDGGYTNNWEFGEDNIIYIINSLSESGIDFVEYGFISDKFLPDKNSSLYNNLSDILCLNEISKPALMFNFGELNIDNFIDNFSPKYSNIELRISFKPHALDSVEQQLKKLKGNGIKFSLNPMHISMYSSGDYELLASVTNRLSPVALVGVDTMGVMESTDTERVFRTLDSLVDNHIPFGFHAHDNKNLALSNITTLIELGLDRELIIDSCLCGLSRGGGIVDTVELARLLNEKYGENYDVERLTTTANTIIQPIKSTLGDKTPYYLSAKHFCHPNYAKYLAEHGFSFSDMERILEHIPHACRMNYSMETVNSAVNIVFLKH